MAKEPDHTSEPKEDRSSEAKDEEIADPGPPVMQEVGEVDPGPATMDSVAGSAPGERRPRSRTDEDPES